MGMQQAIQHQDPSKHSSTKCSEWSALPPGTSPTQTLHSDFEIQYVTEVVTINANKYKNRSTQHGNQLIRAHFNPLVDGRL